MEQMPSVIGLPDVRNFRTHGAKSRSQSGYAAPAIPKPVSQVVFTSSPCLISPTCR